MFAVIFSADISKLDDEYINLAEKMRTRAFEKYHCIDFISVTEGAKEISISYWHNEHDIQQWKNDAEHLVAQTLGRSKWYQSYRIQITEVKRESKFPPQ